MSITSSGVFSGPSKTFNALPGLKNPIFFGCSTVVLAAGFGLLVDPLVRNQGPYLFFAIAVVIAALYGGLWAGIWATIVSIPVCDYLFVAPRHTFFIYDARGDLIVVALFAALGLTITLIIHRFHRTSKQLERSFLDLQRSESKLGMLASSVPEILFTMTGDGAVEYLNEHLSKYSGIQGPDLIGLRWLDLIHSDDRGTMDAELSTCFQAGKDFETSIRLRGSDGLYKWFKCHATPVSDPIGKVDKWFGVCSYIDSEKRLTAALESRTRELMRLNEGLDRFAHTASHDLQAPLSASGKIVELFLRRNAEKIDPESSEMLVSVTRSIQQTIRLTDDILEFATASNASKQRSAPIDTRAIAQVAIGNLQQAIEESRATIVLEQLPVVVANETGMLRLFQNLVANALKYRSEKAPQIHISASARKEEWVFSVKDNGIGIDRQHHDGIFEPFRRLHGQSEYKGSGLGLSACQRIIESFNGRIWVESEIGAGSTFFFTIPEQIKSEEDAPEHQLLAISGVGKSRTVGCSQG